MKKLTFSFAFTVTILVSALAQCPTDHAQLKNWYLNNNGSLWDINWDVVPNSINDVKMTNWQGVTTNADGCVVRIQIIADPDDDMLPILRFGIYQIIN